MTSFEITRVEFAPIPLGLIAQGDRRLANWPVVYVLDNVSEPGSVTNPPLSDVYVGESLNAAARLRQHLGSLHKNHLTSARFIVDREYNKSVCLDLESYLIRMLAGDGTHRVLNRNDGIVEADYFDRERYRERFRDVFDELKEDGLFTQTIREIEIVTSSNCRPLRP